MSKLMISYSWGYKKPTVDSLYKYLVGEGPGSADTAIFRPDIEVRTVKPCPVVHGSLMKATMFGKMMKEIRFNVT